MPKNHPTQFVLCPGFMNDHGLWDAMLPDLEKRGLCHFADLRQDISLEAMAQRTLDASLERFVLMGFSMGGYVAREIVRLAPDRVQALVLMNTSARPDKPRVLERNQGLIEVTRKRGFRGLSAVALKKALHPDRRDDEVLLDHMRQMAIRMGEQAFLNQLSLVRADGRPTLKDITCPTLVIWSRQDELRSLEESEELADGIPNARLEIVEDCGHMTPMEQPRSVLALL